MNYIQFEWDEPKNQKNIQKHGVSFEEAKTVFNDPLARIIEDPEHSSTEERFIMLGMSATSKLLIVCHCYRASEEIIRIISARKATKPETVYYGGQT